MTSKEAFSRLAILFAEAVASGDYRRAEMIAEAAWRVSAAEASSA